MKQIVLGIYFALTVVSSFAQIDYAKQYRNGKELFQQAKYNLAMETFKPLLTYDQKNPYEQYASFYYALAAYKQGYLAVAKDVLTQLRSRHSKWDKIDEVSLWLGQIHFENKDYFQALKIFSTIADKSLDTNIRTSKQNALKGIADIEILRMMYEEYPKDELIARHLAAHLSRSTSTEDRLQLETIIDKHKFNRDDFIAAAPKSFQKEKYSVSVLMPFMISQLDPGPGRKRNQIILDFYQGLQLATDTLNTLGTPISLRAYDTERASDKIRTVLATEELQNTDLIIGPFFQDEIKPVQEFSSRKRINLVHPFTNNSDVLDNPYAFMFQPSSETLGRKAADYLGGRTVRKNSMVFYGTGKKDSVMAANFIQQAATHGLTIVHSQRVPTKDAAEILKILATPTEFDEFKYPSQFTLKKDSIGSIYVASDDALIYAKVITAVESRADSIKVIGSESWLEDPALDPEKFENLKVILASPNYIETDDRAYRQFFSKFVRKYGRVPSNFARTGFELMMFFGQQLQKNGVFFQQALAAEAVHPGVLYEGFNYQYTRDNSLVPFLTFERGELKLLEKR